MMRTRAPMTSAATFLALTLPALAQGETTVQYDWLTQGEVSGQLELSIYESGERSVHYTGRQVYSGTVLDLGPVMLYDDSFRFEVDLDTGATVGEVHLTNHIAGPTLRCHLDVVGTGMTAAGDATVEYTGHCRVWPATPAR